MLKVSEKRLILITQNPYKELPRTRTFQKKYNYLKHILKAHCLLARIGKITLETLEQYAAQSGRWDIIAKEFVFNGFHEKAIECCDRYSPENRPNREILQVFKLIFEQNLKFNDVTQALVNLRKLISYGLTESQIDSVNYIVYNASLNDKLIMLAEGLVPKHQRIRIILTMIETHITKNELRQAFSLLEQFESDLKNASHYDMYFLIDIYVQLGLNENALDLVRNNQEKDNKVALVLKNALARHTTF